MILLEYNGPGGFFTELGRTLVMGNSVPGELQAMCEKNRATQAFDLGTEAIQEAFFASQGRREDFDRRSFAARYFDSGKHRPHAPLADGRF